MMEIKGNRKHLNLSDRINIEKGLNSSDSFKEIARTIQKDPTTVAKEVRRNARVKEYKGYGNIPCEANRDKHNPCGIMHVCGDQALRDHACLRRPGVYTDLPFVP